MPRARAAEVHIRDTQQWPQMTPWLWVPRVASGITNLVARVHPGMNTASQGPHVVKTPRQQPFRRTRGARFIRTGAVHDNLRMRVDSALPSIKGFKIQRTRND